MSYKCAYMQIYPAMGFLTNHTQSFEKLVLIPHIIMALFMQTKLQNCKHKNPKPQNYVWNKFSCIQGKKILKTKNLTYSKIWLLFIWGLAMTTKSELKMWGNLNSRNIKSGIFCLFCPSRPPSVFRSTSQHLLE
jgi:hypothetical protein